MSMLKNRKAISPVIATVILVAVAITVAVAVSYWMGGITSQYTKFEKVEIKSAQVVKNTTYWKVTFNLKNSGSATATLNNVYINDIAATFFDGLPSGNNTINYDTGGLTGELTITSGETSTTLIVYIGTSYLTLSSGTAVNIKIHSAGGMDYIKLVELV